MIFVFSLFQEILSLIGNFIMSCHTLLVHSPFFKNISHEYVSMSMYGFYWILSVFKCYVIYMCFMKIIFCFIPCLKDFVLVNKTFHLTSYGILQFGRSFFFQTKLIFKSIFENPYHLREVGWESMPCMFILKILLNLCMRWVDW